MANDVQLVVGANTSPATRAFNGLGRSVDGVTTRAGKMSEGFARGITGISNIAVAAGAAIAAAGAAAVVSASRFEKGMANYNAVARESQHQLAGTQKVAMQIANQYGVTASDVAANMAQIAQAGIVGADAFRTLNAAMTMEKGAGGLMDIKEILPAITTIGRAFKALGKDPMKIADMMQAISRASKTGLRDTSAQMTKLATSLAKSGFAFQDLGAAFALASNLSSGDAAKATSMFDAFVDAAEKSPQLKAAMGKDGLLGLMNAIQTMSSVRIAEIFPAEQAREFAEALRSQRGDVMNYFESITTSSGKATEAMNQQTLSVGNAEKMWARLRNMFTDIGTKALPVLESASGKVLGLMDRFDMEGRVGGAVDAVGRKFAELGGLTDGIATAAEVTGAAISDAFDSITGKNAPTTSAAGSWTTFLKGMRQAVYETDAEKAQRVLRGFNMSTQGMDEGKMVKTAIDEMGKRGQMFAEGEGLTSGNEYRASLESVRSYGGMKALQPILGGRNEDETRRNWEQAMYGSSLFGNVQSLMSARNELAQVQQETRAMGAERAQNNINRMINTAEASNRISIAAVR